MSYRIDQSSSYQTLSKDQASGAASRSESGGSDSSFDEADDQDWADWVDDEGNAEGQATRALFADTSRVLPTPKAALDDARAKGCDFEQVVKRCQLDALQVIRLVNYIRKAVCIASRSAHPIGRCCLRTVTLTFIASSS